MDYSKSEVPWWAIAILAVLMFVFAWGWLVDNKPVDNVNNEKILEDKINSLNKSLITERNLRLVIDSRIDSINRVNENLVGARDSLSKEIKRIKGKYDKYTPSELEKLAEEKYQKRK
jgi:hypothetical protein